jgi:hypothetical protein
MLTESSPIYDVLVGELGNPVPATPMDCSYQAALAQAAAVPAAVSLPVKRPAPKSVAPKQMAAS